MIKVIAGTYRSRNLITPSNDTEPTKNRVREALFSAISNEIPSACCLDLFAGSGALGIEAMSRGASICFFNDLGIEQYKIIKNNLSNLGISNCSVDNLPYTECLKKLNDKQFDIVFLDPPYALKDAYSYSINFLLENNMLSKNCVIVLEYSGTISIDETKYVKVKTYNYGKSNIMICRGIK